MPVIIIELIDLLIGYLARTRIGGYAAEFFIQILKKYPQVGALSDAIKNWVIKKLQNPAVDAVVAGGAAYYNEIYEGVREYLEGLFNQNIIELSKEELLNAAGKAAAEELDAQIQARFGISFPIPNLYSDTLPNELGEWFADLVNLAITKKLGYEVEPFSTLFPVDNIVPELDTFISGMLSTALGVQITSIMNPATLKQQIETAVFTVITNQVNEAFTTAKGQIQNNIFTSLEDTGLTDTQKHAINDVIQEQFSSLVINLNGLLPTQIQGRKFYFSPSKRLHNKLRQRKYRKTHRMQTTWVLKEGVTP